MKDNYKVILGAIQVIAALVFAYLIDIEGKDLATSPAVFFAYFGGMIISDGFADLRIKRIENRLPIADVNEREKR